jgi:hypothetical protein
MPLPDPEFFRRLNAIFSEIEIMICLLGLIVIFLMYIYRKEIKRTR